MPSRSALVGELDLWRCMLRIRRVEEAIIERYPRQEMRCPVHLCIGQEAIAAGVCGALQTTDQVLSGHRSHGHYLAKGGDLKRMLAEIHGKATGCCGGYGGSMHLLDRAAGYLGSVPIVGSTIPIAVGAAFASKRKGEDRVTVTFCGEAATEEGVFAESLNFAALKQLPVLFVVENNHFSVYSPLDVRQPPTRSLATIAEGHGVPALNGDGNDVVEVHDLAQRAVEHARSSGPVLLEFETWRWREHCGPNLDDDLGYRTPEAAAAWREKCPIAMSQRRLPLTADQVAAVEDELQQEIDDALKFADESPWPEVSDVA